MEYCAKMIPPLPAEREGAWNDRIFDKPYRRLLQKEQN